MLTRFLLPFLLLGLSAAVPAGAADFDLRIDRLTDAFRLLPDADQKTVDEVLQLIQRKEHTEALARLQSLNRMNPENSSLRVVTAYALLRVGNLLGAFDEADKAHDLPNGNSYKCLFYAKIALLTGNKEACKRELQHVKKVGDMPAEAKAVEKDLKKTKG